MHTEELNILTANCNLISDINSTLSIIGDYHPEPVYLNRMMTMLDQEVFDLFVGDIFQYNGIIYLIKEKIARQQFLSASPHGEELFTQNTLTHRTTQIQHVVQQIITLSESHSFEASDDLFNRLVLACYPREYVNTCISDDITLSLDNAIRNNTIYFVREKMLDFLAFLQPQMTYSYTEADYTWMLRSIIEHSITAQELLLGDDEKILIMTFLETTFELTNCSPLIKNDFSELIDLELVVVEHFEALKELFS